MDAEATPNVSSQLNNSHGSFELVLSPVILALIGWLIDRAAGITPWCTVAFAILGLVGATIKVSTEYNARMAEHAANASWNSSSPTKRASTERAA